MAGIEALVRTSELKTNRLSSSGSKAEAKHVHSIHYDDLADTLTILLIQPHDSVVVHYLDDHVGFLYEDKSLEIVGLQVDAFEKGFLPKSRSIQRVWMGAEYEGVKDFGQLSIAFERAEPQVVREVVKAARPILGPAGAKLASFAGA